MISSYFGHFLDKPLTSLAKRIYISPNALTVTGLFITIIAAIVLAHNLFWGGILVLFGGLFDMLDGVVARVNKKSTEFGAFLDSVLDRYSDSFLFLGLTWYFFKIDSLEGMILTLGTLIGALLISYTRARAEGLGKDCHVGIMERPERIVLLSFGALTGWIIQIMWIMCILTHATVIQRIYHVWKRLK
jgi:phosphatidylglycerophosphate synthase